MPLISIIMVKMWTFVCLKLLDMWKSHVSPLLTVQSLYYATGEYWEIWNRKSRYKPCRGRMAQGCQCCWSRTDNQIQKESGKGWKLHEHHTTTFKCKWLVHNMCHIWTWSYMDYQYIILVVHIWHWFNLHCHWQLQDFKTL